MRRRSLLAVPAALALTGPARGQTAPPPRRIRGKIAAVDAKGVTVDSRDGQKIELAFNDPLTVATLKNVDLKTVDKGAYIGTATRAGTGGALVAIEVLVFPDAMRGAGEGHYPWDLEPGAMMTNATVEGTLDSAPGRELSLVFKGGTNRVVVPAGTPVVTLAPGTREDLKVGMRIFAAATPNAEGKLAISRITVEKDGVAPPM